jgi:hypothetical protein
MQYSYNYYNEISNEYFVKIKLDVANASVKSSLLYGKRVKCNDKAKNIDVQAKDLFNISLGLHEEEKYTPYTIKSPLLWKTSSTSSSRPSTKFISEIKLNILQQTNQTKSPIINNLGNNKNYSLRQIHDNPITKRLAKKRIKLLPNTGGMKKHKSMKKHNNQLKKRNHTRKHRSP